MDRFKEHLAAQLRFIERSNQWFDAGDEAEAQRIATSVRVHWGWRNAPASSMLAEPAGCS